MKTRIISFRFGNDLIAEVDRLAALNGMARNQLVKTLLEQAVKHGIRNEDGHLRGIRAFRLRGDDA